MNLPSRDFYCDYNCKDRLDCCDDIEETCSHFFSPRVFSEITFDRGVVIYFHAGVGKTFEEATRGYKNEKLPNRTISVGPL